MDPLRDIPNSYFEFAHPYEGIWSVHGWIMDVY